MKSPIETAVDLVGKILDHRNNKFLRDMDIAYCKFICKRAVAGKSIPDDAEAKLYDIYRREVAARYTEREEALAKDLHRHYRAMSKALDIPRHDHGWEGCSKKLYFLRRARTEYRLKRIMGFYDQQEDGDVYWVSEITEVN